MNTFDDGETIMGKILNFAIFSVNLFDLLRLSGYDLYSSALADILTEPGLKMPITVGLYAKWGSGWYPFLKF
jgi:ankyrin repeat-rich membrane spanning protein